MKSIRYLSLVKTAITAIGLACTAIVAGAADDSLKPTREDRKWLMPRTPPAPADNQPNAARVALGKALFFDTRLSADGNMACASCHNPMYGWSDGLGTARGNKSKVLGRASPTIVNAAYNSIQMWDGRKASLEDQAMGPMESADEMAADIEAMFKWLNGEPAYKAMFAKAYPREAIDAKTLSKAIASFERTVVSTTSPFDRWVAGDARAMTKQQVLGFRLFSDPAKGNCASCHQAPNFTDNGFHNIGLASYGDGHGDAGRFAIKPLPSMRGAFKTPTLRDVALTGPYFHDGSAKTLADVMEHYRRGGHNKLDLSPNVRPLALSDDESAAIVAFMEALTSKPKAVTLPRLPAY
ncbi:cytochrome-c peroxidase [Noviherbaspirillum galbum]|uniref:C-type cytochrome n=1 Tax=Noviherbaspirillum galbum TaxID=2709383 RepID=A0A6B3SJ10_9BURK|nr:cytochrome c peroxidase [Noviherbaspirillum galbum]NEX60844.1 c-type cytochrome [Noviherbaspirillum galbum]